MESNRGVNIINNTMNITVEKAISILADDIRSVPTSFDNHLVLQECVRIVSGELKESELLKRRIDDLENQIKEFQTKEDFTKNN